MEFNYSYKQPGQSSIGTGMSWQQFPLRTEETDESLFNFTGNELADEQRKLISDFTPEKPIFESDQPRRNTWATENINLRMTGSYGGERLPWKDDDYDTQFHDADPRGWQTDQNWQLHRRDAEARIRRQPFRNDADYSIPSGGIRVEDMQAKIKSLRAQMKGRLNWFMESQDAIASGRGPKTYNTHSATEFNTLEDTSANIDTSAIDLESLKNYQTLVSNSVHLGSRYFDANTTTDHKVPVAGYGYIFKRMGLESPQHKLRVMSEDRKINPLGVRRENRKDLMRFLASRTDENRAITQGAERFNDIERTRYTNIIERQNAPQGRIIIKDIMSLLGITENEIKYINSLDQKNKIQQKQMIMCLAEVVQGLEQLPPNARLELRDELLWARVKGGPIPKNKGGLARAQITIKAREALKTTNTKQAKLANSQGREAFGDPESKIKDLLSSGNFFVSKRRQSRRAHLLHTDARETVPHYEDINEQGRFMPCQQTRRAAHKTQGDRFIENSIETIKTKAMHLSNALTNNNTTADVDFGRELYFNSTLQGAPRATSTNAARFHTQL